MFLAWWIIFLGTRILLRDTTLMPDIPGLPALITMLFTPVMELRLVGDTWEQLDMSEVVHLKTLYIFFF